MSIIALESIKNDGLASGGGGGGGGGVSHSNISLSRGDVTQKRVECIIKKKLFDT